MSFGALHVARTGLDAQGFRMQVIANNLANVNTTGFKRDRASFETLSYQMMTQPGAPSSAENRYATGLNLGTGVALAGTARIDTQGSFATTGNGLDVAIDGAGYFQVQMPDGRIGYTRAGNFGRAADGTVVTSDGKPVQPQIQIPEDSTAVSIGADGTVSATTPDGTITELGRIEIAPIRRGCRRSATICSSRRKPRARRKSAAPARKAAAPCGGACSRGRTSTSSRNLST
jgi:flagellar basal-body rod protein FlgG